MHDRKLIAIAVYTLEECMTGN